MFEKRSNLPVSASEAFEWHARPGALDRLIPPWERVTVVDRGEGISDGSVVKLTQRLGPLRLSWIARHEACQPGVSFRDLQVAGPFHRWEHDHRFEPVSEGQSVLVDEVTYRLPGGPLGRLLDRLFVRRKVETMFEYRHKTTQSDLAAHRRYEDFGAMNVAVTGASGLVGATLVPLLTTGGHSVTRLVRRAAGEGEVTWNPDSGSFDGSSIDGTDAVVHLAGENIASGRWTEATKHKIYNSRVAGTKALSEGLAAMRVPPRVLVCASAIGIYGDRGDELLDEDASRGSGFLADVAADWEEATRAAIEAGIRVVHLRFGVILSPRGGALQKMLTPFRLGLGGRIGSGDQYWSWISIDDAAGAIHHALSTESLVGPVNAVAPEAVTNAEFTKVLGSVLRRPTVFPVPRFGARLALGEMADALLLASLRVVPQKLIESNYEYRQSSLDSALRRLLGISS